MTLTKADMIASISDQCGFLKAKSTQLVEAVLVFIKDRLESGEKVLISGFGKFSVRQRKACKGRNPFTGRVVEFKFSRALQDKLNGTY